MRHGEDPVAKMTQQNPRDSATSGTRSARSGPRVCWLPTTAALAFCQASAGFLGCGSSRLWVGDFFLLIRFIKNIYYLILRRKETANTGSYVSIFFGWPATRV